MKAPEWWMEHLHSLSQKRQLRHPFGWSQFSTYCSRHDCEVVDSRQQGRQYTWLIRQAEERGEIPARNILLADLDEAILPRIRTFGGFARVSAVLTGGTSGAFHLPGMASAAPATTIE